MEFAAGVPHLLKGEVSDDAGTGIDVHSLRSPLGVVAGRCASAAEVIAAVVAPRSASGTRAWTSPVSGSYTSPWAPEVPRKCLPSTKWVNSRTAEGAWGRIMAACSRQVGVIRDGARQRRTAGCAREHAGVPGRRERRGGGASPQTGTAGLPRGDGPRRLAPGSWVRRGAMRVGSILVDNT